MEYTMPKNYIEFKNSAGQRFIIRLFQIEKVTEVVIGKKPMCKLVINLPTKSEEVTVDESYESVLAKIDDVSKHDYDGWYDALSLTPDEEPEEPTPAEEKPKTTAKSKGVKKNETK